jgi:hypothetical protein
MVQKNMICGYTISRDDIVSLSRNIAAAVPLSLLEDADAPLTIAIKGSYSCGKKIISDSFVEAIMGVEPCPLKGASGWSSDNRKEYGAYLAARHAQGFAFEGHAGRDEAIIARRIDGTPIELLYIDVLYSPSDLSFCADAPRINMTEAVALFNAQRQYGGITFLQNADNLEHVKPVAADVEIWLENDSQNFLGHPLRCPERADHLREIFDAAATKKSRWGRYCEVKINNDALGDVLIASKASLYMRGAVL